METLGLQEILALAFKVPAQPGIYFLIRNGEVVYVGQSAIPMRRLGDHARDKIFDSVAFVPCPLEDVKKVERQYIKQFQPVYNGDEKRRFQIRAKDLPPSSLHRAAASVRPANKRPC